MRKKLLTLATVALLSASLFASGTKESIVVDQTSTNKLSGKVVVYCPSPTNLSDAIAEGFEAKTGVKVEMFQGTTGKINARLEAEKDNPQADVVIMASWPSGMSYLNDALSYDSPVISKINNGWIDDEHKLFGYSASALAVIYNTLIFPTLDADWNELGTNSKYIDQICMPDPFSSGSCMDFVNGFVNDKGDEAFSIMQGWADNGITIPGANKPSLAAVTTGEKGILIAGVDYNGYSSIAKGEPLAIYYPEGGTVVNPRPAFILKTSQNLENAKAYIDYLFSDEAQQMVCDAYLLPGSSTVKATNRSNVSDIPLCDYDWDWMQENSDSNMAKFSTIMDL